MDDIKTISLIYKRIKVKDNDKITTYMYQYSGVLQGHEVADNADNLYFVPDADNTNGYGHIDDMFYELDEYVYSFPININDISKENANALLKSIRKEIKTINSYTLFQTVNKKNGEVKSYCMNNQNTNKMIAVNTNNIDGLKSILTNEAENVEEVKEAMEEANKYIKPTAVVLDAHRVYADEIYDNVSKTVISQDEQIKSIAAVIAKNQRITIPELKSNLLICGPTGVGKTEIFRCISKLANLPMVAEDSLEYTANGFKGKDVTDILYHLYINANKDIEKTQRGIVLIDEIDKKVSTRSEVEVYTTAVLDSLLKMAEGHVYHIEHGQTQVDIDTSFITFAMCGAFSGIEQLSSRKRSLGFVTEEEKEEQEKTTSIYTNDTLKKYGLKPEFLGRSKTVVMNALKEEDYCNIINNSNKSQLLLYKYLLESMGINFIYEEGTVEAIAKKAVELGAGARSIKKIIETAFELINYDVFSNNNYTSLIISPDTIEDNTKYILK